MKKEKFLYSAVLIITSIVTLNKGVENMEGTDTRKMICDRCRKAVPISDVRYIPKGESKIALCSACRAKSAVQKGAAASSKEPQKQLYICSRCNYKFSYNPRGLSELKCPYCGQSKTVKKYKALSADRLVKAADKEEYF